MVATRQRHRAADEFQPGIAHQHARQQPHLGQHLKAVADAQHIAAPRRMGRDRRADRRLRGNGAAAQIIAKGKPARNAHHIDALRQARCPCARPAPPRSPRRSKATARSRSQFDPGKVMTAAFIGGRSLMRGLRARIAAIRAPCFQPPAAFTLAQISIPRRSGDWNPPAPATQAPTPAKSSITATPGGIGPLKARNSARGLRQRHLPRDDRAHVDPPRLDQRQQRRIAPAWHAPRAKQRQLLHVDRVHVDLHLRGMPDRQPDLHMPPEGRRQSIEPLVVASIPSASTLTCAPPPVISTIRAATSPLARIDRRLGPQRQRMRQPLRHHIHHDHPRAQGPAQDQQHRQPDAAGAMHRQPFARLHRRAPGQRMPGRRHPAPQPRRQHRRQAFGQAAPGYAHAAPRHIRHRRPARQSPARRCALQVVVWPDRHSGHSPQDRMNGAITRSPTRHLRQRPGLDHLAAIFMPRNVRPASPSDARPPSRASRPADAAGQHLQHHAIGLANRIRHGLDRQILHCRSSDTAARIGVSLCCRHIRARRGQRVKPAQRRINLRQRILLEESSPRSCRTTAIVSGDLDRVFLDHRIGQQLFAHRPAPRPRRRSRSVLGQIQLDHLALPHARSRPQNPSVPKRMAHGLALRVKNTVFQHDVNAGFHRGMLAFQLISVGLVVWVTFEGSTPRRRASSV